MFNFSEKLRVCSRKKTKKNLFCDKQEMVTSAFFLTTNKFNRIGEIWNWENCPFVTLFSTIIYKKSIFTKNEVSLLSHCSKPSNKIVITKKSRFSRLIVWKICRIPWRSYPSEWIKVSKDRKKFMESLLLSALQLIKNIREPIVEPVLVESRKRQQQPRSIWRRAEWCTWNVSQNQLVQKTHFFLLLFNISFSFCSLKKTLAGDKKNISRQQQQNLSCLQCPTAMKAKFARSSESKLTQTVTFCLSFCEAKLYYCSVF